MLLCSDGIQAVSLGLFVQGIKLCQAVLVTISWAKTGQCWDLFGLDSVGLYWWEFSGYSYSSKTTSLMEHIEAQHSRNYQQVFYYDF